MDFAVLSKEMMSPKLMNDDENGHLYCAMMKSTELGMNEHQSAAMDEFVKYLERKRLAKKKGKSIKLAINDSAFEQLDELLLMTESKGLFPLVSMLRLLLIDPDISNRYTSDFMIINQMLYKIGIEFESEEEEEKGNEEKVNDDELGMNFFDIGLLQFSAIGAISHLYLAQQNNDDVEALIGIHDNFIN